MQAAEKLFELLQKEFGIEGAVGCITFGLNGFSITVEQNNVVGNILEEWLAKWMTNKGIVHLHNQKQAAPDFWLNPDNLLEEWLEVKSFTGAPNFDVAAFRSFINLIVEQPWKLHSKYLLIKYRSEHGVVTIERCWLKSLWEICSTSGKWPLKVQYKNNVIVNIRPSVWYSERSEFPSFASLEDFLAALEETIYRYHDTRATIAETWSERLCASYKAHYGVSLTIPRWNDIKHKYVLPSDN